MTCASKNSGWPGPIAHRSSLGSPMARRR
jgi:hypothetical protein